MTLADYLRAQTVQRGVLKRLSHESGLDYSTVWNIARRDHRLDSYSKAKALSAATGGAVSIEELCDRELADRDEPATGTEG